MTMKARLLTLGLFGLALIAPLSAANVTVLSEAFGGLSTAGLSGTTADIFDSAITTAGGSSTWVANAAFKADGSVASNSGSAYLKIGSYINALKGTADGKFILTATIGQPSGSFWISVGFSAANLSTNLSASNFVGAFTGVATAVNRIASASGAEYFGTGTTVATTNSNAGTFSGAVTFTTTLDFTTAGGYDGTNNFGKVTFANSFNSVVGSYTYTADTAFNGLGFTTSSTSGAISALSLVHVTASAIPEPATYAAWMGLGLLGLAGRRRFRRV
jgi:hypothetical protein